MRIAFTISFLCLFLNGCKSQKKESTETLEINKSIKDSFAFAKKLVGTTDGKPLIIDGYTAIVIPERMGNRELEFNAEKKGFEMPCQCAYKNDTLVVLSALAWEGGFAYVSKATKKEAVNSLMMFGKNRKWTLGDREYKDEIEIPSCSDKLVISKPFPLKLDQLLYGCFEINTEDFFEVSGDKSEKQPQRHVLKIFFSCKVFPEIL